MCNAHQETVEEDAIHCQNVRALRSTDLQNSEIYSTQTNLLCYAETFTEQELSGEQNCPFAYIQETYENRCTSICNENPVSLVIKAV